MTRATVVLSTFSHAPRDSGRRSRIPARSRAIFIASAFTSRSLKRTQPRPPLRVATSKPEGLRAETRSIDGWRDQELRAHRRRRTAPMRLSSSDRFRAGVGPGRREAVRKLSRARATRSITGDAAKECRTRARNEPGSGEDDVRGEQSEGQVCDYVAAKRKGAHRRRRAAPMRLSNSDRIPNQGRFGSVAKAVQCGSIAKSVGELSSPTSCSDRIRARFSSRRRIGAHCQRRVSTGRSRRVVSSRRRCAGYRGGRAPEQPATGVPFDQGLPD